VDLGNVELMKARGVDSAALSARADAWRQQGQTVLAVAIDGQAAGMVAIPDQIRPTTRDAIGDLKRDGLRIVMLTGDTRVTADAIAKQLEIDEVFAGVLPGEKRNVIER